MTMPDTDRSPRGLDPDRWVDAHADLLYSYALQRVRRPEVAEELVQETFLAALRARGDFAERSSERTWLVGILRHKIVDHIRREARARAVEEGPGGLERCFTERGHWRHGSADWGRDPAALLERDDFREVLATCLSALPQALAYAFSLRELEAQPSREVCKALGISAANLWVRLHRARLSLKECLEAHWFRGPGGGRP